MADLILTDTQQTHAVANFLDKKGKPAKIDGVPTWTCSDSTGANVVMTANPDGSADFVAADPQADTDADIQVTCTGDADLGAGVESVVLTGTLRVVAGKAVAGAVSFGAPTEQA